jgi:GntR family transcriptional regulator/MocR family aminotransferase
MQAAMATFIDEGHLQRHLRRAQRTYRERRHLMLAALTDRLAGRGRALPSDAGLHITVLIDDQITDDELRANTRANGLRVPPLGGSYRFTSPRCGWVVGFGAISTPDVPAAVDALVTALAAATRRGRPVP